MDTWEFDPEEIKFPSAYTGKHSGCDEYED